MLYLRVIGILLFILCIIYYGINLLHDMKILEVEGMPEQDPNGKDLIPFYRWTVARKKSKNNSIYNIKKFKD